MNKWRILLAEKIAANGGYCADRWTRYAIEYNVSLDRVDLSPEHMYELATWEEHTNLPLIDFPWNQDNEFEWAQQCAARGVMDGDDCAYRSYGADTAIRFGLPYYTKRRYKKRTNECAYYPAKVSGWIIEGQYANVEFEVEMGLYGRGGKHLCIAEFEGRKLDRTSDDLVEAILEVSEDNYFTNKWCQKLLAMMHVWEEMFTPTRASAEIEYQAAYNFATLLQDAHDELDAKAKQEADTELAYKGM